MHYVLGILVVAAVAMWQPAAPTRAELDALGPQVGERVPDFALVDQGGASRTLQSILGPNGALLVFFRSAEW
jgi:hypothetical protein